MKLLEEGWGEIWDDKKGSSLDACLHPICWKLSSGTGVWVKYLLGLCFVLPAFRDVQSELYSFEYLCISTILNGNKSDGIIPNIWEWSENLQYDSHSRISMVSFPEIAGGEIVPQDCA